MTEEFFTLTAWQYDMLYTHPKRDTTPLGVSGVQNRDVRVYGNSDTDDRVRLMAALIDVREAAADALLGVKPAFRHNHFDGDTLRRFQDVFHNASSSIGRDFSPLTGYTAWVACRRHIVVHFDHNREGGFATFISRDRDALRDYVASLEASGHSVRGYIE